MYHRSYHPPQSLPMFSEEQVAEFVKLYNSGITGSELARRNGCSVTTMCKTLKDHGVISRGSRNFSDEEEAQIAQRYLNGESTKAIGRSFGLDKTCIISALKRQGVSQRSPADRNRLYSLDPHVFDVIDNELAAYWWGFLWADGYVRNRSLVFTLKLADKDTVEKLKYFLKCEHPVRIGVNKTQGKEYGTAT